jgi:hypothetical protein
MKARAWSIRVPLSRRVMEILRTLELGRAARNSPGTSAT